MAFGKYLHATKTYLTVLIGMPCRNKQIGFHLFSSLNSVIFNQLLSHACFMNWARIRAIQKRNEM